MVASQPSPSRQPFLDPGRGAPMEQFKIGETVAQRESIGGRRGTVVRVTTNGFFVTVKWPSWLSLDGYESTHRASDLVRPLA
jgi:hypothetical protein